MIGSRTSILGALLVCVFGGLPCMAPARAATLATRPAGACNVRDHGAAGDGKALDTAAINTAIETCAAAGGGQVSFPPGRYLTGTIHLRSRVTLRLEAGATLVGSPTLEHYRSFSPPAGTPEARFRNTWHRALILGEELEEVAIVGEGTIDGNKVFDPQGEERMRGPHTILLGNSRGFTLRGVSIRDSANYAVMLEGCSDVEVRDVRFTGGWDGVHFRGWKDRPCRNVSIVGCQFYTGDDSIAGRYWENVVISDCIINSSCNGIRLIGPAKGLIIHDCLFYGPGRYEHRSSKRTNMLAALCLQPGAWDATEGPLDDVVISDITAHNVTTPFHFMLKPGNTGGKIRVSRVTATGVYRAASSVESWGQAPFEDVAFSDIQIEYTGGGTAEQAGMTIKAPGVDARPLPAWGFFARNVKTLRLENVRLHCETPDLRPVVICENVGQLVLDEFRYTRVPDVAEPLRLKDVGRVERMDSNGTETPSPAQPKPASPSSKEN